MHNCIFPKRTKANTKFFCSPPRGGNSSRSRGRGRGKKPVVAPVTVKDARFKIIENNRKKMTDARDKLVEIAKNSDARLIFFLNYINTKNIWC